MTYTLAYDDDDEVWVLDVDGDELTFPTLEQAATALSIVVDEDE